MCTKWKCEKQKGRLTLHADACGGTLPRRIAVAAPAQMYLRISEESAACASFVAFASRYASVTRGYMEHSHAVMLSELLALSQFQYWISATASLQILDICCIAEGGPS